MIYLDNAATTKIHPKVLEAMMPWLTDYYGNAGSNHGFGKLAKEAMDKARSEIADVVGCFPDEIIFTSGGTEADNFALCGTGTRLTSSIEHKAVLKCTLNDTIRCRVTKDGVVDLNDYIEKIDNARMVSIMAVNNETGVAQPYEIIAMDCRISGKSFHTDAVQAFGHRPIDITNINFMSVSGHKINGPKGIGFLYADRESKCRLIPSLFGGGQEFGLRSGTEPVALIVGLAEAVKLHSNPRPIELGWLEDRLVTECDAVINGVSCHQDPWKNIINFQLDVHNDTMIQALSKKGIYLSAGSACNASSSKPSYVLKAMGLSDEECNRSLRMSVGDGITMEEADIVINEINTIRKEQKLIESLDGM